MTSSAKQRIIGAFVLLALGLIFFPVLFDLSVQQPIDTSEQIPPMPVVEPIKIAEPEKVADIIPPKPEEQVFQPEVEAEDVSPESETPALNEAGLPTGWLIQLGSFSDKEKAYRLNSQLKTVGYKSYTQSVTTSKGEMLRVFVGPKINKKDALDEQQQIEKQFKLETILREFKP